MLENNISQELQEILIKSALNQKVEISKELEELVNLYLNDKNSSTIRQFITAKICGYINNFKKFGYDAIDSNGLVKEIKPSNKLSASKKIYSGSFGFSDYTLDRFNADKNNNVNVLQSCFIDGKLMYIIEFPISDLEPRLLELVEKFVTQKGQRYIRKAEFSFFDLTQSNIVIKYVSSDISKFEKCFSKRLYDFIMKMVDDR